MMKRLSLHLLANQKGVTIVLVAILLVVLIGFAAIAVDLAYLYIVKGELQNAADSGALAGAQVLYITDPLGVQVNAAANQTALDLVSANYSEQSPVSIESIERGHWSFATREFIPNNSLLPVSLWNVTSAQLDANSNFINAVRVITTRKIVAGTGKPAGPFFAGIFGAAGPVFTATAVAYIGFAGTIIPETVDWPFAICKESLIDSNGAYTCANGRSFSSGKSTNQGSTGESGGWTDYNQFESPSACKSAADMKTLKDLTSSCNNAGNPNPLVFGNSIETTNAMGGSTNGNAAFGNLYNCWKAATDLNGDGLPEKTWPLTLPVIECGNKSPGPCNPLVGVVEVEVIWIQDAPDKQYKNVPPKLIGQDFSTYTGAVRWNKIVESFAFKNLDNSPAAYMDKTVYLKPVCKYREPTGLTGGQNFGILAKIPVLVK
jgi:Flp pilus assembly protein TadG